jgi:hypothetical protein
VPILSMAFAVTSVVGGILLALGGGLPISPYVTTISFAIWVVCRIVGGRRDRRGRDRVADREQRDQDDPSLQAGVGTDGAGVGTGAAGVKEGIAG